MSQHPPSSNRGRGLVIAGSVVLALIPVVMVIITAKLMMDLGPYIAFGFPAIVVVSYQLGMPLWLLGISLVGVGRARQRGPVRGHVIAWFFAIASLPLSAALLLGLTLAGRTHGVVTLVVLFVCLQLNVGSIVAGARLVWGPPPR